MEENKERCKCCECCIDESKTWGDRLLEAAAFFMTLVCGFSMGLVAFKFWLWRWLW